MEFFHLIHARTYPIPLALGIHTAVSNVLPTSVQGEQAQLMQLIQLSARCDAAVY